MSNIDPSSAVRRQGCWPGKVVTLGLLTLLLPLGSTAWAQQPQRGPKIFLNGVEVGGMLKGRSFTQTSVKFDEQGNLHISAPGYSIKVEQPAAPPTTPPGHTNVIAPPPADTQIKAPRMAPATAGRYWMVVDVPMIGHYRIRATMNGRVVAELDGRQSQHVKELTGYVTTGDNEVELTFMPLPDAPKITGVKAMKVMLGRGSEEAGDTLAIDQVLGTVELKTGQSSAFSKRMKFKAR